MAMNIKKSKIYSIIGTIINSTFINISLQNTTKVTISVNEVK
ncbi:hypothetical protein J2Y40_000811 [Chryseobacterium sp. 2987]|nr:hypothetical protein [Chryseobacterium sp. 2987]